jgi:hypothetical protein
MNALSKLFTASLAAFVLALGGCATQPPSGRTSSPPAVAVAPSDIAAPSGATVAPALTQGEAASSAPSQRQAVAAALPEPAVQARILALDPEHLSDRDVQETLAKGPAPRIVLLHGGIYPVHLLMESFGRFLSRMGYPEARIRDPRDRAWSYSPYEDSRRLAGMVAWEYERSGLRPMLIGHSQGGMQAVKVLHELAGHFGDALQVFDPTTGSFEERTTIVDPLTQATRPVVGVSVAYASAVGAGGAAFLLPNQWSMLDKLDSVPDTVDEFTGFFIGVDLIAWSFPGAVKRYEHNGTAKVRNVTLPATYSHVFVPLVGSLPQEPEVRAWINDYVPGEARDASMLPGDAPQHVLWAADVWYSIKKHWCLEAQRWLRAQSADAAIPPPGEEPQ